MTEDDIREIADTLLPMFTSLIDGQPALAVAAAMGRALGETIDDAELVTICIQTAAANAAIGHADVYSPSKFDPDMITMTRH